MDLVINTYRSDIKDNNYSKRVKVESVESMHASGFDPDDPAKIVPASVYKLFTPEERRLVYEARKAQRKARKAERESESSDDSSESSSEDDSDTDMSSSDSSDSEDSESSSDSKESDNDSPVDTKASSPMKPIANKKQTQAKPKRIHLSKKDRKKIVAALTAELKRNA
jgi:hypothetical protein